MKIVIAGPKATGKTLIANYLAGQASGQGESKLTTDRYEPTAGVRILEFDLALQGSEEVNIELWDASGDHKYESCWKAIMTETDGVILIYNPDAPAQDQQIGDWFEYFVRKNGLKDEQCMVFAHRSSESSERFRPPPLFSKVTAALTTAQSGSDIADMFRNFLKEIKMAKQRK